MDELIDNLFLYLDELVTAFMQSGQPVIFEDSKRWTIGDDGIAREEVSITYFLGAFPHSFKDSSATYQRVLETIRSDPDFGDVVGSLVSNVRGFSRFDEDTVVNGAVRSLSVSRHSVERPSREAIAGVIDELRRYIISDRRFATVIIPFSGLKCSILPFVLEDGLEIVQLTGDEIDCCVQSNLLRPWMGRWPILGKEECVGARIPVSEAAHVVHADDFQSFQERLITDMTSRAAEPHMFGDWSRLNLAELVDDLLFAFRLAGNQYVGASGAVLVAPSHMGESRTLQVRASRQVMTSTYELNPETGKEIRRLWMNLKTQSGKPKSLPKICQTRFNLAVDRSSLEDSLIDHMIAAEAFYLKGSGEEETRGELGFRLALRASLFLQETSPNRRDTYRFAKKAYDLRSRVAHGGKLPISIRISGRESAISMNTFVDELAALMQNSIRRAIDLFATDREFGTAEYWDELLFSS
jgi:hypothetical protein